MSEKHIIQRFDFETICAGVLRIIDNKSLYSKYKKYLDAEWFFYNDNTDQVRSLRDIIKLLHTAHLEQREEQVSIEWMKTYIRTKYLSEETGNKLQYAFNTWLVNKDITNRMADEGCFSHFVDYLKVVVIARDSRLFFESYQHGEPDKAANQIQSVLTDISSIGKTDREILDATNILQSIRDSAGKKLNGSMYLGCTGLDDTIGGFEKQTLSLFISITNGGKCLGLGTPIIMYDGTIKKVEDVVVGDLLMGDDSTPRKVLSLARGREEMFKIIPKKGDAYIVNKSHILTLLDDYTKEVIDMPLEKYLNLKEDEYLYKKDTNDNRKYKRYLSVMTGVDFEPSSEELEMDPYLLGCSLEGSISHEYKTASRADRLQLLAGIIDTYGHKIKDCDYDIVTESELLCDDISFLARSLGLMAIPRETWIPDPLFNEAKNFFVINILGDGSVIPVRKQHNISKAIGADERVLNHPIEVEPLGVDNYYGFTIDGNHRFLLGDFTVTHNTMMCHHLIRQCLKNKIPAFVSCVEDRYDSFIRKAVACYTGIPMHALKRPQDLTASQVLQIEEFQKLMDEYIRVEFIYGESVDACHKAALEYENDLKLQKKHHRVPVVNIIDYSGHISGRSGGDKMYEKMRAAYGSRKDFALKYNKICFDFAQVNREGGKRLGDSHHLTQTDLAGAFDIAQVCDNIITINRNSEDVTKESCVLYLTKCRDGAAGVKIRVKTDFARARYDMEQWDIEGGPESILADLRAKRDIQQGGSL